MQRALNSGMEGYHDVFRFQTESGYRYPDIYALRLDLSDVGDKSWLLNVASGIDSSIRRRDRAAVKRWNQVLEERCRLLPGGGVRYV